jgi:hypothetical protein
MDSLDTIRSAFFTPAATHLCLTLAGSVSLDPARTKTAPGIAAQGRPLSCPSPPGESASAYAVTVAVSPAATVSGASTPAGSSPSAPNVTSLYR